MGLANIVPGVSGGTMVLALGLYEFFIRAMAEVTRPSAIMGLLKGSFWRHLLGLRVSQALRELGIAPSSVVLLVGLFGLSAFTILLLSRTVGEMMEAHRYAMYALFIGMTLGGAPLLWREVKPLSAPGLLGGIVGFCFMAAVALLLEPGYSQPSWFYLFLGGIVGSSAMILPGISGSYMLLVMGIYTPILFGISEFTDGLRALDVGLTVDRGLNMILPVGLGLVVGIGGLSNVLQWLFAKYHKPTVGFLLGLLLGSVLGLYPFQLPSFDKLSKYAVTPAGASVSELRVKAYGFGEAADDELVPLLKKLETPELTVSIAAEGNTAPTPEAIRAARVEGAIVIVRDIPVPTELRRLAREKVAVVEGERARDLELVVLPDTRFSVGRAILCAILGLIGMGLTVALGRMEVAGPEKREG